MKFILMAFIVLSQSVFAVTCDEYFSSSKGISTPPALPPGADAATVRKYMDMIQRHLDLQNRGALQVRQGQLTAAIHVYQSGRTFVQIRAAKEEDFVEGTIAREQPELYSYSNFSKVKKTVLIRSFEIEDATSISPTPIDGLFAVGRQDGSVQLIHFGDNRFRIHRDVKIEERDIWRIPPSHTQVIRFNGQYESESSIQNLVAYDNFGKLTFINFKQSEVIDGIKFEGPVQTRMIPSFKVQVMTADGTLKEFKDSDLIEQLRDIYSNL